MTDSTLKDQIAALAREIERLAFQIPPPNAQTPQLVSIAQTLQRLAHEPRAQLDIGSIMTLVQEFASSWSLVGGRFDDGSMLEQAEERRAEIRRALDGIQIVGASPPPEESYDDLVYRKVTEMAASLPGLDKDECGRLIERAMDRFHGRSSQPPAPVRGADLVTERDHGYAEGYSDASKPALGWQAALTREALQIADAYVGYPERGPADDTTCTCSYCRYARVRTAMATPTKAGE